MGAYRKNLKFGSMEIVITDSEIKFKTPKQAGTIIATEILGIEVQRARLFSFGHMKIKTATEIYEIEFVKQFNSDLEDWKKDFDTGKYKARVKNTSKAGSAKPKKEFESAGEKNEVIPAVYKVIGKNPETGRKKTAVIVRSKNALDSEITEASGLMPPYTIERQEDDKPTEAQVEYAKSLGFEFPQDATIKDASIFLTRAENGERIHQRGTAKRLLDVYIGEYGIYIPRYANAEESHAYFFNGIKASEKVAYFVMRVYNEYKGTKYMFPCDATESEQKIFDDFSKEYIGDQKFMDSMEKYNAYDLPIGGRVKKQLKAYEIAWAYLKGIDKNSGGK